MVIVEGSGQGEFVELRELIVLILFLGIADFVCFVQSLSTYIFQMNRQLYIEFFFGFKFPIVGVLGCSVEYVSESGNNINKTHVALLAMVIFHSEDVHVVVYIQFFLLLSRLSLPYIFSMANQLLNYCYLQYILFIRNLKLPLCL